MMRVRNTAAFAAFIAAVSVSPHAEARRMVFGETWENGTASWRTQRNNGSDCKGWPTCPFDAGTMPGAPPQMLANTIFVKNGDGDGGRDNGTCSGKYIHIPRSYAGYDAGNLNVVGGITQGAVYRNAQFVANGGDRMCVVAWVRAFPEADPFAGPMVGINYTGSHGVVDAGHNHGTHWMIGPLDTDPANFGNWSLTPRTSYGPQTQLIQDGKWHRYTAKFMISPSELNDSRRFNPELGGEGWNADGIVYGQPRLSLYGRPPERRDVPDWVPAIQNGADFGDVFFFKAENAAEDPCPPAAELDLLDYGSDHIDCGPGKLCKDKVSPLPAGDRSAAQANNVSFYCAGCNDAFGAAAPGPTTCTETMPFCTKKGPRGGSCTPCASDAGAIGADPTTQCTAAAPYCLPTGACGKCTDEASCMGGANGHAGPSCDKASGACFSCASDRGVGASACAVEAPLCNYATGKCSKCIANDDCVDPAGKYVHGGPTCDRASGACVACASDLGGPIGPTTCAGTTPHCRSGGASGGTCGMCSTNDECTNGPGQTTHAGPICDAARGLCGRCNGDSDVSSGVYGCKSPKPNCGDNGACRACASNADCVNPPGVRLHLGSVCNVATGACEGPVAPVPNADGSIPGSDDGGCAVSTTDGGGGGLWVVSGALLAFVGRIVARRRRAAR